MINFLRWLQDNHILVELIISIISLIVAIIMCVRTYLYVNYTKGILKANKDSAKASLEQIKMTGKQQEENRKISLHDERLKIYCQWVKLIEDARSDINVYYTMEEKFSLNSGTKFLFSEDIAKQLKFYIDNYEKFCQYERLARKQLAEGKAFVLSAEEQSFYDKYKDGVNEIDDLLSEYMIIK